MSGIEENITKKYKCEHCGNTTVMFRAGYRDRKVEIDTLTGKVLFGNILHKKARWKYMVKSLLADKTRFYCTKCYASTHRTFINDKNLNELLTHYADRWWSLIYENNLTDLTWEVKKRTYRRKTPQIRRRRVYHRRTA